MSDLDLDMIEQAATNALDMHGDGWQKARAIGGALPSAVLDSTGKQIYRAVGGTALKYIMAAQPQTVLALIARIRELEAQVAPGANPLCSECGEELMPICDDCMDKKPMPSMPSIAAQRYRAELTPIPGRPPPGPAALTTGPLPESAGRVVDLLFLIKYARKHIIPLLPADDPRVKFWLAGIYRADSAARAE